MCKPMRFYAEPLPQNALIRALGELPAPRTASGGVTPDFGIVGAQIGAQGRGGL